MAQQNGNMAGHTGISAPHKGEATTGTTAGLHGKGKGKATDPMRDVDMADDDDDDEEDEDYDGEDDEVSASQTYSL